jgi:hypothetical protein
MSSPDGGQPGRLDCAQDALHHAFGMSAAHAAELLDGHSELVMAQLVELELAIYIEIKRVEPRLTQLPQWDEWMFAAGATVAGAVG